MTNNYTDFNKNKSSTEVSSNNQIKTTDVNVLLNRVRLDKKKTIKKNIIVSLLLVSLICSIAVSFII
ncbi:hypothetical protein IDH23_02340 [Pelagibacterales bacterium SAG-MED44]|nr:hypothetical protein [Pelagibacterales bacterium SAG-MED44]|tara:strand:+ start:28 stop:228 length:201 start_codon:yes stop_codon:yes gene_type:complete